MEDLRERVTKLEQIVKDGNGTQPLLVRMALVEQVLEEFVQERKESKSHHRSTNLVVLAALLTFAVDIALRFFHR